MHAMAQRRDFPSPRQFLRPHFCSVAWATYSHFFSLHFPASMKRESDSSGRGAAGGCPPREAPRGLSCALSLELPVREALGLPVDFRPET